MARMTVKKTTTTKKKTSVTIRPKSRSNIRSANAKKQKRNNKGQFA